ncbi:MAG: hypothetical protein RLZZ385_2076 [Pseudomonadota bacterium]|jgi:hydrogenase/urease accessory protein HupE
MTCRAALLRIMLLLSLGSAGVQAHEIDVTGVARLFLQQQGGGLYHLSVLETRAPPLYDLGQVLPARCESLPTLQTTYRFQCSSELTLDDVLVLPWDLSGVVVVADWQDGTEASAYFPGNGIAIEIGLGAIKAGAGSWLNLLQRYSLMGIEHILLGIDHLFFVLGLVMLLQGTWRLVKAITAFTVAHSLTLACAVLGYLPLSSAPVEAVIALSILLLAREIIMGQQGHPSLVQQRPWVVALIFGLFHGLGFAGALGELGLRDGDIPLALLSFNLGVEAGQLAFIAVLLAYREFFRRLARDSQQAWIAGGRQALAYGLGGVATFWFLQRLPAVLMPG